MTACLESRHFSSADFDIHSPFSIASWVSSRLTEVVCRSFCAACFLKMLSSFRSCSFLIVIKTTRVDSNASSGSVSYFASGPGHGPIHSIGGRFAGPFLDFRCQNWAHIVHLTINFQDWTHLFLLFRHFVLQTAELSWAGSWTWRSGSCGFTASQAYHWSSFRLLLLILLCQSSKKTAWMGSYLRSHWGCRPFSFLRVRCA